jgi:hypothetical protein
MRPAWLTRIVSLIFVAQVLSLAQSSAGPTKSPKAVVEEFWKMETQGGRLTTDGWRSADRYFVRPIEPPNERVIGVVDNGFSIEDAYMRSGNAAVVTINVSGLAWKIDSKMRIRVFLDQVKGFVIYDLVLTSKHWEFTPDHRTLREVSGEPEWRIEKDGDIWLAADTAIRYLSQVRDTATDSVIKKNAEQSLATLRRHH